MVLRHAGAFGNKLVRGLGTPGKQKIASSFGSSYRVHINPSVGAAEGCELLKVFKSAPCQLDHAARCIRRDFNQTAVTVQLQAIMSAQLRDTVTDFRLKQLTDTEHQHASPPS